eukprot:gnl/Spiro4/3230_TR1568_c0_g1_i1.p1 gnl/Spiro4/3230_TR1568_c0_g1~~gnl/Spiro4/3230_TR1568_c0_g1_i1.p1  ORF type:complete len:242 (+),score=52.36 gnl/Spiro4/3230_TR1568_c0_g1_i1:286-1011(+)
MPLIFCMISSGSDVLCECTNAGLDGNFGTVSKQILQQISADPNAAKNKKMTFVFEGHTFNFHRAEFDGAAGPHELYVMCMCDETFGRTRPFQFLKDITESFRKMFPKIVSTDPSTYHSFNSVMVQRMAQYSGDGTEGAAGAGAGAGDGSALGTIQAGLDDVKSITLANMEKVIKRGEAIELLVDKSEQLTTHAERFRASSGRLQRAMCWAQVKSNAMVGLLVVVLIYVFVAAFCGLTLSSC